MGRKVPGLFCSRLGLERQGWLNLLQTNASKKEPQAPIPRCTEHANLVQNRPTVVVIRLVFIVRVSQSKGWVLAAGQTGAAPGLDPSSPQSDGVFWRHSSLGVRVGIRPSAQGVALVEDPHVGTVTSSVRGGLANPQLRQGEVSP